MTEKSLILVSGPFEGSHPSRDVLKILGTGVFLNGIDVFRCKDGRVEVTACVLGVFSQECFDFHLAGGIGGQLVRHYHQETESRFIDYVLQFLIFVQHLHCSREMTDRLLCPLGIKGFYGINQDGIAAVRCFGRERHAFIDEFMGVDHVEDRVKGFLLDVVR